MGNQEAETKRPALRLNPRRLALAVVIVLAVMGLARCAAGCLYQRAMSRAAAEAKSNTHSIQLAVERCATDDPQGSYVTDVNEVVTRGYLDAFPPNPFAGLVRSVPSLAQPRPMRALEPGQWSLGDFVYIPRRWEGSPENEADGYTLVLCLPLGHDLNPRTSPVAKKKVYGDMEVSQIAMMYRDPDAWR